MVQKENNTNLNELLLRCMSEPAPLLSMLEWLFDRLMEAQSQQQLCAEKTSVPIRVMVTAVVTELGAWTHVLEHYIYLFLKCVIAVTFPSLLPDVNAVNLLSWRLFAKLSCKEWLPVKQRNQHKALVSNQVAQSGQRHHKRPKRAG